VSVTECLWANHSFVSLVECDALSLPANRGARKVESIEALFITCNNISTLTSGAASERLPVDSVRVRDGKKLCK
jgi:hypothetical protein